MWCSICYQLSTQHLFICCWTLVNLLEPQVSKDEGLKTTMAFQAMCLIGSGQEALNICVLIRYGVPQGSVLGPLLLSACSSSSEPEISKYGLGTKVLL